MDGIRMQGLARLSSARWWGPVDGRIGDEKMQVNSVNPTPALLPFKGSRFLNASGKSHFRPSVAGPALAPTPHGPSGVNCMLGGRPVDV